MNERFSSAFTKLRSITIIIRFKFLYSLAGLSNKLCYYWSCKCLSCFIRHVATTAVTLVLMMDPKRRWLLRLLKKIAVSQSFHNFSLTVRGEKLSKSNLIQHILFKNYSKCCIWIFGILAFSINFCPINADLSGNTVWPQASIFQKLAKKEQFWHFELTYVHSICKRSSLRSQCWMRLFLWFSNSV